ncbi:hypothetical protein Tco_1083287, partial [Tanacetum coccineum]
MLRVLTITLIGTAKRLVDRLSQGTINTWDLLKNAFIQRGAHLNKDCPLNEEVKGVKEVNYREFGRPFLNNNGNGGRYRVGPPRYYTRMDNQPTLGERRPSLVEIITKYMEDSAKKEAEHDEWLRKFKETTEKNQRGHYEIIHNLETKDYHFIHCSTTLLRNRIFLADSSLSDEEVQKEIEEAEEINDEAVQPLGWHLEGIHVTWTRFRKKWTRIQLYMKLDIKRANSVWRRCRKTLLQRQSFQATASEISVDGVRSSINAYDEPIGSLGMMNNEVGNTSPQSTAQILPSFKEYTSLVTYPEEVEETLGTPMEEEPLDHTKLDDVGLNTYNHDIPLSSREVSSFDELEPQPNPLPNCPPLDISPGDKRG